MLKKFIDEGMGPELSETISNYDADKGDTALYFYKIDEVTWIISDRPITRDIVSSYTT